jgi:hypothetical protein
MDTLILTEAFRELSNLRAVRIDVISFYRTEPEDEDRGINCGRKQMFKKDIQDYDKHDRDRHGDDRTNRVYYLVLQALERAKVHAKIKLRFEFWARATTVEKISHSRILTTSPGKTTSLS